MDNTQPSTMESLAAELACDMFWCATSDREVALQMRADERAFARLAELGDLNKEYREDLHPRGDDGTWIEKAKIIEATTNQALADEIRSQITDPLQLEKFEKALAYYSAIRKKSGEELVPENVDDRRESDWLFAGDPAIQASNGKKVRAIDVGLYLSKLIPDDQRLTNYDEADKERLAQAIASDGQFAFANDPDSANWYSKSFQDAMETVYQKYPEMKDSPGLKNLFVTCLVINSNGVDVLKNFEFTDVVYSKWKETGRIPTDLNFQGQAARNMKKQYELIQKMLDKFKEDGDPSGGVDKLAEFMNMPMKISQVKKFMTDNQIADGKTVATGEAVEFVGTGANILGAKLGAFHANLSGDFQKVTMDRWFARTMGRMQGTMFEPSPELIKKHASSIVSQLQASSEKELFGVDRDTVIADMQRAAETGSLGTSGPAYDFMKAQNAAYSASGFKDKTDLNKSAKNLNGAAFGLKESPQNASEREFYRAAMGRAVEVLKERGIDTSPADLQAVLWYNEKRLWERLGIANKRALPISYRDAARAILMGDYSGIPESAKSGSSQLDEDDDEEIDEEPEEVKPQPKRSAKKKKKE